MIKLITLEEYLMGRDVMYPLNGPLMQCAIDTVSKANRLLDVFGEYRKVTSGYRPAAINAKTPGAAKRSNHIICCAVDLEDRGGKLYEFCMTHLSLLARVGLWLEEDTWNWVHVQTISPRSGRRTFKP